MGRGCWFGISLVFLVACGGGNKASDVGDVGVADADVAGRDDGSLDGPTGDERGDGHAPGDVPDGDLAGDVDGGLDVGELGEGDGYLLPAELELEAAWGVLREASSEPVRVLRRNGVPEVILLDVPVPQASDNIERALLFFEAHREVLGLSDPRTQLAPTWAGPEADDTGASFTVLMDGIPLYASHLGIHFKQGRVRAITGAYVPLPDAESAAEAPAPQEPAPQSQVTVTGAQATSLALQALDGEAEPLGPPQLVYFAPQILTLPEAQPRLAWVVVTRNGLGVAQRQVVDAGDGSVVLHLTSAQDLAPLPDFNLSTVKEGCSSFCWLGPDHDVDQWYNSLGKIWEWSWDCEGWVCGPYSHQVNTDGDGDGGFDHLNTVYDYFKDTFGQYAWLNQEIPLPPLARVDMKVHAVFRDDLPVNGGNCGQNAKFIPGCGIAFSTGWVTLDMVAHEFTHGLVATYLPDVSANYVSQTGAINESLADTFAWFVDSGNDRLGEGVQGAGCCANAGCWGAPCPPGQVIENYLRDPKDPAKCGDPDHMEASLSNDGVGLCSGSTQNDSGWVHKNCMILTSAAYRLVKGGPQALTGISSSGIGLDKAKRLYWRLVKSTWSEPYSFNAFAWALVRHAEEMREEGSFTNDDVCAVRNAFAGAGLYDFDPECAENPSLDADDLDSDGTRNDLDNCKTKANTDQADQDGDGHGDACDPDRDGDFRLNFVDNCPTVTNADQKDSDSDGSGDECEDPDSDGVFWVGDNCPAAPNPAQVDFDGDGKGDACDPDDDGDTILDASDKCPKRVTSADENVDSDGDGLGAGCDNCDDDPNGGQEDLDYDGQGDPCDPDLDGDGIGNGPDNCVDVPNVDQADCDEDNFGMACDPGDVVGPPSAPEPATPQEFMTALSFASPFEPRPLSFPIQYCSSISECLERSGASLAVRVQLGYDSAVRLVDEQNRVLAHSSSKRDHVLRFQGPVGLVQPTKTGLQVVSSRRLYVEVLVPGLISSGDARCKTYITGPESSLPNLAPMVDAGPDLSLTVAYYVHVGGLATDPNSDPLKQEWTQTAGPHLSLTPMPGVGVALMPTQAPATITLRLTATDPEGLSAYDEMVITVEPLPPEGNCMNSFDDDFDGFEDCLDSDCDGVFPCAPCVPNCAFWECGPDGCGGECGTCDAGSSCVNGFCYTPQCLPRSGSFAVSGLKADSEGTALWNSDGTGVEPAHVGHTMTWALGSPCYDGTSYYYVASRDYVDPSAASGGHATGIVEGFPLTAAALAQNGLPVSTLTYKFGPASLGDDLSGQNWYYTPETNTEMRYYMGGTLAILVQGQEIASGAMPMLVGTLSYGDINDCTDDAVSADTGMVLLTDTSASASAAAQAVAAAFMADLGAYPVRLVFETLEPIGQSAFSVDGRNGAYFENQSGRLEIGYVVPPSCQ